MISRPDHIAAIVLAVSVLGGCGDRETEQVASELLQAQITAGDASAARLTIDRVFRSGVSRSEIAALAGEVALQRGDLENARQWLGDGDFSVESAPRGYLMLARLERYQGLYDAAAHALIRARDLAPRDTAVWVEIGRLRYAIGDHLAALEASERAIQLDPQDPEALRFRGHLIRDAQGIEPAERWVRAALPLHERSLRSGLQAKLRALEARSTQHLDAGSAE